MRTGHPKGPFLLARTLGWVISLLFLSLFFLPSRKVLSSSRGNASLRGHLLPRRTSVGKMSQMRAISLLNGTRHLVPPILRYYCT
jgi:hypothetical protein